MSSVMMSHGDHDKKLDEHAMEKKKKEKRERGREGTKKTCDIK
jgi:hypothetical protein